MTFPATAPGQDLPVSHPPPYPLYPQPARTSTTNGLAVAALVLGIITVLVCWIPYVGLLGSVTGLVGAGLGIAGLVSSRRLRTGAVMASFGLGLSAVGAVAAVVVTIVFTRALFDGDLTDDDIPAAGAGTGEWVSSGELEFRLVSVGECEPDYDPFFPAADCPLEFDIRNRGDEPAYVSGQNVLAVADDSFQTVTLRRNAEEKTVYRVAPGTEARVYASIDNDAEDDPVTAVVFSDDEAGEDGVAVSVD